MNLLACVLIFLTTVLLQVNSKDLKALEQLSCELDDVKRYIVDRHNELRANVRPTPSNMLRLEWSDEAAICAANWAKKCTHAHSKSEEREIPSSVCGENLYMASKPHSWQKAIQAWYDEHKDFKYGVGAITTNAPVGHYTQMVWYRSNLLGCAMAHCPTQPLSYYYVCHYCPAGNSKKSINEPYGSGSSCANCTHACVNGLCTNPCEHHDEFDNCNEFEDLCDETDEDVSFIKDICKATCICDDEIQ
ncbi:serotriflin-like [Pelobates fuscus]|uniref:serotriflin-like n=1 Tax=Pelobates fuscus TaxID=191477 RepID=UPI002FE47A7D